MKKSTFFLFAALTCIIHPSLAQKVVADKIVAQIGGKIILDSDIDTLIDLEVSPNIDADFSACANLTPWLEAEKISSASR